MKGFALTHCKDGVIEFDESLANIIALRNRIYKICDVRFAELKKTGLNYSIVTSDLVRRSDGTPCGDCNYCRVNHLSCPYNVEENN